MKKYEKYKDSGIEWIGEIPEHWEVIRGKEAFVFRNGFPFDSNLFSHEINDGFPLVRIRDLKSVEFSTFYKGEVVKEAIIDNDDLIIGMDGDFNIVQWKKGKALLNQRLCKIEGINGISKQFLFYCLPYYLQIINDLTYFTTVKHLSNGDLFDEKYLFPSLPEQTAISTYLDHKTAQIDNLISKKEKLIELLKEERVATINQAVTIGLDEKGNLRQKPQCLPAEGWKDSGIEWLGEIPVEWEVKRMKDILSFGTGLSITKQDLRGEGVECVNYGEIHSKYGVVLDTNIHKLKFVDEKYLDESPKAILNKGDFIFADTSEDIEGAGNFTHLKSHKNIFAGYHTIIAKPKVNIESIFFAYEFDSLTFRTQIRQEVKGIKVFSITQSILKNTFLWMPPLKEQLNISNYLTENNNRIDTLIQNYSQQITLLKEYKTALISEVVTGKVDVREEQIN